MNYKVYVYALMLLFSVFAISGINFNGFFKTNKLEAYKILEKVGVRNASLEDVYKKLTSPNMFYNLLNQGKVNPNDENLVVKYDVFNSDDLFRKRK